MFSKIGCAVLAAGLISMGMGCGGDDDDGTGEGPGSKLMCKSSGKNAFETYKLAGFAAANKEIITETLAAQGAGSGSANLGTSFTHIGDKSKPAFNDDAATFEGKLAAFLVFAYGGPQKTTYTDGKEYDGDQDMVAAHTGLAITQDQFNFFVMSVIVPSTAKVGVTTDDITSCFAPVVLDASFQASIIGH